MIKMSVLYPQSEGSTFDLDYYVNSHMPMVQDKLGAACKGVAVEAGIAGRTPDAPPMYTAMGHLLFDSMEAFQAAFAVHGEEIRADVPNFTNIRSVVQISEVRL